MPNRTPYFLTSLHKNLLRLASLALCVQAAPRSRTASITAIAEIYGRTLLHGVQIKESDIPRVRRYLVERGLLPKYTQLQKKSVDDVVRAFALEPRLEAQDWWLSDPTIASMAGAEREQNLGLTVTVAEELGLLNDRTLTIAPYGQLLQVVAADESIYDGDNPFATRRSYAWAAYMQVLRSDWEFTKAILGEISAGPRSFREDFVPQAGSILNAVATATPATSANRSAAKWLQRQIGSTERLYRRLSAVGGLDRAGADTKTLLRPLEDVFLPRLEFLVDVNVLKKPDTARFGYVRGDAFAALKGLVDGPRDSLDSSYFRMVATALDIPASELEVAADILDHLKPSFERLKGVTGYAPILEGVVASNVRSGFNTYVEPAVAMSALRQLAVADPPRVRVVSDRFGHPQTFTLTK